MLLVRTKDGYVIEVEPRFVTGKFVGFIKVDSNYCYDYNEVTILSKEEIEAIRQLPDEKLFESAGYASTTLLKELKQRLNMGETDPNFETLGAHIRNILSPYANIVQMLEKIHDNETDERTKKLLTDFLLTKTDPKKLRKNLNHFIAVSNLQEIEHINWRGTKLFEEYEAENEKESE